jgi:hypothetical protein
LRELGPPTTWPVPRNAASTVRRARARVTGIKSETVNGVVGR